MPRRFADARPEIIWWHNRASLSLNWFEQHTRYTYPYAIANLQLSFHSLCVTKRNVIDRTAIHHAYWLAIISFSHHGERTHRLAMKRLHGHNKGGLLSIEFRCLY